MNTPAQSGVLDQSACSAAATTVTADPGALTKVAWFYDSPMRDTWNMALDEALLLQAAEGGPPTFRFYEWDQPTLSLGYFQRYLDREQHVPSRGCPVVRRTTGGGAILHDRELTYSCTLNSTHRLARHATDLYYAIHQSLIAVLARLGIAAHLHACDRNAPSTPAAASACGCGTTPNVPLGEEPTAVPESFLCFRRRTEGDVIFNGQKIVGSAQRRSRGAVLQHGSILLTRSDYAPELPGIRDLQSRQLEARDLVDLLCEALAARLQFDFVASLPLQQTLDRAAAIEATKFATDSWRRLR